MVELARRSTFTQAQEDYLKALYHLRGDVRAVPTRDLAQRLGISSPSVSEMVARLTTQGLVEHDRYRGQQLTREGRKVALHDVSDEDPRRLRELERRGLRPGTRLEVVAASEYEGPIEVRIKGRRLSIPLGLARAMFVEAD